MANLKHVWHISLLVQHVTRDEPSQRSMSFDLTLAADTKAEDRLYAPIESAQVGVFPCLKNLLLSLFWCPLHHSLCTFTFVCDFFPLICPPTWSFHLFSLFFSPFLSRPPSDFDKVNSPTFTCSPSFIAGRGKRHLWNPPVSSIG